MQFKLSTVLAVAPLFLAATTYGNPVAARATKDFPVDTKEAKWTDLGDNWEYTKVSGDGGNGDIVKRTTHPADWFSAHWSEGTSALVDKFDSRTICLAVGSRFTGTVVRKNIGDACNAVVNKVPGATLADGSWTILNRWGLNDMEGDPAYLQFVLGIINSDVKPTVQLCQSAMQHLIESACMQEDKSKGGMMAVGNSFLVGFNPQKKGEGPL